MTRTTLLVAIVGVLALAPAAHAATVYETGVGSDAGGVVEFHSAPGEQNAVTLTSDGTTTTIVDTGAALTAGLGCTQAGPNSVQCDVFEVPDLRVELGDGNDTYTFGGGPRPFVASYFGGPGDDHITTGASRDWLYGDGGHDVLSAGGGTDRLLDGDEAVGTFDADTLDGGAGRDAVLYAERTTAMRVNLTAGTADGAPGETDALAGVESAYTGAGDDLLVGSTAGNSLYGGDGDDSISGLAGADTIDGEGGRDRVNAGSGPDRIYAAERRGRAADDVGCGPGRDTIFETDAVSLLHAECDVVLGVYADGFAPLAVQPAVDHGVPSVTFRIPCRRIGNRRSSTCSASIVLKDAKGRTLGRGSGSIRTKPARFVQIRSTTFTVPLRLTPRGRARLRRRGQTVGARLASRARVPGLGTFRRTATYRFVLR
jgi:hypothetical protein